MKFKVYLSNLLLIFEIRQTIKHLMAASVNKNKTEEINYDKIFLKLFI